MTTAAILGRIPLASREAIGALCASTNLDEHGATSHGALDLEALILMLLADVALAVHRPGSWEGANMRGLLASHGYTAFHTDAGCITARSAYWNGRDPYTRKT